jgi:hypothetical protein
MKSGNQIYQLPYQKYSCTSPSGIMRRRRDENHSPQKNTSIWDSGKMKKMDIQFLTSTKQ